MDKFICYIILPLVLLILMVTGYEAIVKQVDVAESYIAFGSGFTIKEFVVLFSDLFESMFAFTIKAVIFTIVGLLMILTFKDLPSMFSDRFEILKLHFKLIWFRAPKQLCEYLIFIKKNEYNLPSAISRPYWDIMRAVESKKPSLNYASLAYLEPDFINAFSKLKVILEDENYYITFNKRNLKPNNILEDTIYKPLENAFFDFKNRAMKYENIVDSTKDNELNTLLTQDFNTISNINK